MAGGDGGKIRVTCVECHFSTVVARSEGLPADVIIEHGRETGHKLTTEEVSVRRPSGWMSPPRPPTSPSSRYGARANRSTYIEGLTIEARVSYLP